MFAIAVAKPTLHLVAAPGYGDELYSLACAEHLDWGCTDHHLRGSGPRFTVDLLEARVSGAPDHARLATLIEAAVVNPVASGPR